MSRRFTIVLFGFLFVLISGCKTTEPVSTLSGSEENFYSVQTANTLFENFEGASKGSYTAADVVFASGTWNLNDALVGSTTSDVKNGTQSVRVRNSGKITMQFDKSGGAGTVTILHAKYGSDASTQWSLWYSTNSGSSWTQAGSTVTTSLTTLTTASFTLNVAGSVRIEIRKTDATTNRVNIDDITITDYVPNNPVPSLTSIYPLWMNAGSSAFTLTVTGTNFISTSVVTFNGSNLTTTFVSSTVLQAAVPAALLNSAGTVNVTVTTPAPGGGTTTAKTFQILAASSNVNGVMGNPSAAAHDVNYPNNYLIERPQYVMSYSRDRGTPNWVSWQLNSTWVNGPAIDSDQFTTDNSLPAGWNRIKYADYTNSGFSRGHMCASADRKVTQADMDSVYLMTNIVPQTQAMNGGPWEILEGYCRTLANQGNVLYVISGVYGTGGTGLNGYKTTYASGKLTIPAKIWKVIMVLPAGTNDLSRVSTSTRTIAVVMDNNTGPFNSWGTYRVSIDSVESLTGYDFFSNVPASVQSVIEANPDSGPTN
ncbi:MAG: DNA/RNA non-specific endonuclease [Ignavibacteria bacterium]|nr:DNA/RNA non-specific endonuclease [Ignavibacteria bacterium]